MYDNFFKYLVLIQTLNSTLSTVIKPVNLAFVLPSLSTFSTLFTISFSTSHRLTSSTEHTTYSAACTMLAWYSYLGAGARKPVAGSVRRS